MFLRRLAAIRNGCRHCNSDGAFPTISTFSSLNYDSVSLGMVGGSVLSFRILSSHSEARSTCANFFKDISLTFCVSATHSMQLSMPRFLLQRRLGLQLRSKHF